MRTFSFVSISINQIEMIICFWFQNTEINRMGFQGLQGTGSCISDFRGAMFIECNAENGTCHYTNSIQYSWLGAMEDHSKQGTTTSLDMSNPSNQISNLSKCKVCMKMKKYNETPELDDPTKKQIMNEGNGPISQ